MSIPYAVLSIVLNISLLNSQCRNMRNSKLIPATYPCVYLLIAMVKTHSFWLILVNVPKGTGDINVNLVNFVNLVNLVNYPVLLVSIG